MDVKGEIYEGLLERNAQDVKGDAGQYFTPRALIQAMVEVMQPDISKLYKADNPARRKSNWDEEAGTGRWRSYSYDDLITRDKTNLDIFWLKDDSLEDTENLMLLCSRDHRLLHEGGYTIHKNFAGNWYFRNATNKVISESPHYKAAIKDASRDAFPENLINDPPALYAVSFKQGESGWVE